MKKNSVLGGMLWLIYSVTVLFSFCYIAMAAAAGMGFSAITGLIAAGAVLLVAGLVNVLVQRMLRKRRSHGSDGVKSAVAEGIALVVILAGTLVWRFLTLGMTSLGECYELAKVGTSGAFDPGVTNGALNLYLRLLHGVLWVLGNTGVAVYGLQLILFMGLVLVFYFGVRSLCGQTASLISVLLLGASLLLGERFLADTPDLLFCLEFFLAFWAIVTWWDRWNRYQVQRNLPMALCRCLVTGVLIGLGIYMDSAAILLVPLLVCTLIGGRKPAGEGATDFVYGFWNLRPVSFLVTMLFGTAAYIGMLWVTGVSAQAWLEPYLGIFLMRPAWLTVSFGTPWEIELVVVTGVLTLGVFTAWNRLGASDEGLNGWSSLLLTVLILITLQCCGILTDAPVDSYLLLYLFLLILAGTSVADLFTVKPMAAVEKEPETVAETEPMAEPTPEPVKVEESAPTPETIPEPAPAPAKDQKPAQVTFLESPLPLPKKPAHKALDYDIEVADDDDYDIK